MRAADAMTSRAVLYRGDQFIDLINGSKIQERGTVPYNVYFHYTKNPQITPIYMLHA